jgi:hypothetical protein
MARQLNGPWDPISGKAGPLIGRIVDGEGIITGLHKKSNKPPTQKQLDQQLKWRLVTDLLAYIGNVINIGFATTKKRVTAMNQAVSYNLANAITGVSPAFTFDPSKITISKGKLWGLHQLVGGTGDVPSQLKFIWKPQTGTGPNGSPTDKLTIVVYDQLTKEFVTLIDTTTRSVGEFSVSIPGEFVGNQLHCYLFLRSATKVSDSQHIGPVVST